MFKMKTLKILSVMAFFSAMVSSVYSMEEDHSLDGQIGRASSRLCAVAKDLTRATACLIWENPVPFVVAGTCMLLPQLGAMPTLDICSSLMETLGETVKTTTFLSFNNTIVSGLKSASFSCFNIPKTLANGPWKIGAYVCDVLYATTLICPAPGYSFCTEDPYTADNAKCWGYDGSR